MPSIDFPQALGEGRVRLRALAERDAEAYAAAFVDDPGLGVAIGTDADPTAEEVVARLPRIEAARLGGESLELAVTDARTDAFVGALTLHAFRWRHRRAELGLWIAPGARRQGYTRRACELALNWLFEDVGLERIELTTTPENIAAQEAARALGFVLEGTLRDRCLERGRRVTELMYGLLRDEWRAARAS